MKEGGDVVPIMQYADDTIVFVEAKEEMVLNLKMIFLWFEATSGL